MSVATAAINYIYTNTFAKVELSDGVAIVWMDLEGEKINKVGPATIAIMEPMMENIQQNPEVKAVVLMSKKKDFVAGADVEAIYAMKNAGEWEPIARQAHRLLNLMESSPKPIVAAINGAALGAGLELALACHYRIATDEKHTLVGLPEVQLGLLPGGGGTQRLPELVGVRVALDMMLTGKKVFARKAKKLGIVDRVVNPHALLRAAKNQALSMAGKKIVRKNKLQVSDKLLEGTPVGRSIMFSKARETVTAKTQGNYPAAFKIIDCVEIGLKHGRKAGFEAEIRHFDELTVHPVSKQLMGIFFNMTAKKKNPMQELVRPISKTAMLGAGFMGAGIAEVNAKNDIHTILKDIKTETISSAKRTVWDNLSKRVKKKAMGFAEREQIMNYITGQLDYRNFDKVDMVIEAVFEDLDLKKRIIKEVEAVTHDKCIFASNTSALPIKAIADAASRPELVIGMHYFSPVPKMPLLEIIVTDQTADWVTATALDIGIRQGKTCIVVKDGPGFYTTRILAPLMNEALLLLEEGGDILQIDKAAQQLGFPVGPVTLMDEVGIDVAAHIMTGDLTAFFKERGAEKFKMSSAPLSLKNAGYQGRKNKVGFYLYDEKGKKKKGKVNEEVYRFFGGQERSQFKNKDIRNRLMMMITNEAARCLEEGILSNPTDGDVGAIFGLGYPPFTGGPFRHIDSVGADAIVSKMNKLAETYGGRFEPAQIIIDYANAGKKFHDS